jgi:hypothetical protein
MVATVQDGVVAPVHGEAGVIFLFAGGRTPWARIAMLPNLGVVDEPLLLCGRHLSLLNEFRIPMKGASHISPEGNNDLPFICGEWDSLAMEVVHDGAFAAFGYSFFTSGVQLVHHVLLTDRQPYHGTMDLIKH